MTSEAAIQPPKNPEKYLIPISLQFHLSIDGLMGNAFASQLGAPSLIPGFSNGTLSKIANFLFISRD